MIPDILEALPACSRMHLYLAAFFFLAYLIIGRGCEYWRLRHFKGPLSTSYSWWWHSWAVYSGQAYRYYGQVTQQFGPIARIAPSHLVTSSPALWARLNAVRSPYQRAPWYYHAAQIEPGKDNVFTDCDNDSHDARRKKLASGYAGRETPNLESIIDTHVCELVDLVRRYATTPDAPSKHMDLAKKIPYFTLDVISHVGIGKPFGDLKADADVKQYLSSMEFGLRIGCKAFAMGTSWMKGHSVLRHLIKGPSLDDEVGFGRMMKEVHLTVDERKSKPTNAKTDILASFVRNGITGDDLFHETFEQILAGSDTTAAAIRIILLYVLSNPRVHKQLQQEIDQAVAMGVAPTSPAVISDTRAKKLPYLGAVVREGLRIHPPVVNLSSRVTPSSGDFFTIDDTTYNIPGGTLIGYSAWTMHRNNTALYGSDAATFRPERWLVAQAAAADPLASADIKEKYIQMVRTNDMVFGYGRWVCPGRMIALIEVHKCVFELLRHFDMILVDPLKPWTVRESLGLWEIADMWVTVGERSSKED